MKKLSIIFGTRPEAIKIFPLILSLKHHAKLKPHVCVTGQHREMLNQILDEFQIQPDADLDLMKVNQTLSELTARAIEKIDRYLNLQKPDMVIVQGDTTTSFCAALSAFYQRIPIAHIEAGLRTWNIYSPFPEEVNRVFTSKLADIHFAPTESSKNNLIDEGVQTDRIHVTGNTVIDALLLAVHRIKDQPPEIKDLPSTIWTNGKPLVLVTGHRRESFGPGFRNICEAIALLAKRFPQANVVYPVHLNPNVQKPVYTILNKLNNVYLIKPLNYLPFVSLMNRSEIILTDSGGIQEEAPSLGKPILVMRETTERPEALKSGIVKIVGTDPESILENATRLLKDNDFYNSVAKSGNPYGDGKACRRIIKVLEKTLLSVDDIKQQIGFN